MNYPIHRIACVAANIRSDHFLLLLLSRVSGWAGLGTAPCPSAPAGSATTDRALLQLRWAFMAAAASAA